MDRISQLPDDQFSHILSFLPTENAMASWLQLFCLGGGGIVGRFLIRLI